MQYNSKRGIPWLLLSVLLFLAPLARAATPPPLWSITEEDDGIFTHQDRHYTQGLRVSRLVTAPADNSFWGNLLTGFGAVSSALGAGPAKQTYYRWPIIGQSIFTPQDKQNPIPLPGDRPYAGWLYIGAGLMRESTSGRVDQAQLLLGVVGPYAFARQIQNGFHSIAGYGKAEGWNYQLHNEPALLAQYKTTWNIPLFHYGYLQADARPQVGVTLGNVLTYGAVGGWLRLGHDFAAGGLPQTITPGLSGIGQLDTGKMNGAFGWMAFGGIQTRAVWRNIFLEGNSYQSSPGVQKRNFVTDELVGVSFLFHFGLRVDITYVKRGREFSGQNYDDRFGSVTLSAPL